MDLFHGLLEVYIQKMSLQSNGLWSELTTYKNLSMTSVVVLLQVMRKTTTVDLH